MFRFMANLGELERALATADDRIDSYINNYYIDTSMLQLQAALIKPYSRSSAAYNTDYTIDSTMS